MQNVSVSWKAAQVVVVMLVVIAIISLNATTVGIAFCCTEGFSLLKGQDVMGRFGYVPTMLVLVFIFSMLMVFAIQAAKDCLCPETPPLI